MTRPNIIRADTIDLQHDQQAPSAQKHSRHHVDKPVAPHQAATVKHVTEERIAENEQLSQSWADDQQDDGVGSDARFSRDEQAIRQNGGMSSEDGEMVDAESDEDFDEELMDKISSSPSIDDGGYTLTSAWPDRSSSLTPLSTPTRPTYQSSFSDSSSPFTLTPSHFPLSYEQGEKNINVVAKCSLAAKKNTCSRLSQDNITISEDHHLEGEYLKEANRIEFYSGRELVGKTTSSDKPSAVCFGQSNCIAASTKQPTDQTENALHNLLLPSNDPLLECRFQTTADLDSPVSPSSSDSGTWQTENESLSSWDESDERDDESDDISFSDDPRFVGYGWSAECLREIEDIDFEFVYALHTFVATVDGQANATKGDTMVLLDDSNSYWWLVRIVKDNSIGYLPAEHIETPTERLARLNKHRNIDLSQSMLGDNAEKSKNPLKKAMRRRIAKTVQFTAPTYVEASDYDYTSEEESDEQTNIEEGEPEGQDENVQDTLVSEQEPISSEDHTVVASTRESTIEAAKDVRHVQKEENEQGRSDEPRPNEDNEESQQDTLPRSRNGTVRNTDSFFKDESRETRKITLTPNLLREDNSGTPRSSDSSRGPSLEGLDKGVASEKSKDDKKKKEKKTGMLSGLFKRKDKKDKGRNNEDDTSDQEKVSGEILRGPSPKDFNDVSPTERRPSDPDTSQRDRRVSSRGKLQKLKADGTANKGRQVAVDDSAEPVSRPGSKTGINDMTMGPTLRTADGEGSKSPHFYQSNALLGREDTTSSGQTKAIKQQEPASDTGGMLDNLDVSKEMGYAKSFQKDQEELQSHSRSAQERLSDSPVRISPSEVTGTQNNQASNAGKQNQSAKYSPSTSSSSSQSFVEVQNTEPPKKTPISDPDLSEDPSKMTSSSKKESQLSPENVLHKNQSSISSQTSSSKDTAESTSTLSETLSPRLPDWSDASLLSYLNEGSDMRDLLLLIQNKFETVSVGLDHPAVEEVFGAERNTLVGMSQRLDQLLGSWMNKKTEHETNQKAIKLSG